MKHRSNVGRLDDVSVHDWYRFVYAYSDRLVADLIDEFGITDDDLLLDPFNGTGTTTLAAKKLGIDAIGVDTSPASVLSARAKTNWEVDLEAFRRRRSDLVETVGPVLRRIGEAEAAPTESGEEFAGGDVPLDRYDFAEPEKVPKGWLSPKPLAKMTVLRHHVEELPEDDVTDLFRLAMIAILPEDIGNVRFAPEATRAPGQEGDVDVLGAFERKLDDVEGDLREIRAAVDRGDVVPGETEILRGDARRIGEALDRESDLIDAARHGGDVDYLITSPPYPAEHDYTRNQRLELVWLGACDDNEDLRAIKKRNIRSHTKNIYVDDDEGERVNIRENDRIDAIVSRMEAIIEEENVQHGFGQYYPRVIEEYFAGMQCHFEEVFDLLAPGGKAAYVVGDSGSYWQVEVETAEILGQLAERRVGFEDPEIDLWRNMRATTADYDDVEENVLVLTKPD